MKNPLSHPVSVLAILSTVLLPACSDPSGDPDLEAGGLESAVTATMEDDDPALFDFAEQGRFEVVVNAVEGGMRDHFLLDTATGAVWLGYIPLAEDESQQAETPVDHWVAIKVDPEPEIDVPEPGRFYLTCSKTWRADKFLFDSATGRVWCRVPDATSGLVFRETIVEEPTKDASPVPAPKGPQESNR